MNDIVELGERAGVDAFSERPRGVGVATRDEREEDEREEDASRDHDRDDRAA